VIATSSSFMIESGRGGIEGGYELKGMETLASTVKV